MATRKKKQRTPARVSETKVAKSYRLAPGKIARAQKILGVLLQAARDSEWLEQLVRFHAAFAPFEWLAAVVAQELLAGVRGRAATTLERTLLEPFERRRRLVVPSYTAWKETGAVLSALVASGQVRWPQVSRSLVNDILLAMSCREAGVVLVTMNTRDFARIAKVRPFDFVAPWPIPVR